MTRRLLISLAVAGLTVSLAQPARSQNVLYLQRLTGDTAVGAVPSRTNLVPVAYSSAFQTSVQYVRVVVSYDPTKLVVHGAASGTMGVNSAVITPGRTTIEASGQSSGRDSVLFYLSADLTDPAGTYLRIEPDSIEPSFVPGQNIADQFQARIGQVCHASVQYGDIDRSGSVTSRDALIALSAAVGLPIGTFTADATLLGDVDGDTRTSSRDALAMLSAAIFGPGNPPGTLLFTGPPDACPGITGAAPEDMVFVRDTLPFGRTMMFLPQGSSSPAMIVDTVNGDGDAHPRLHADGISVLFRCLNAQFFGAEQICTINIDGSNRGNLTPVLGLDGAPDWSPGASGASSPVTFDNGGNVDRLIGTCFFIGCSGLINLANGALPVWSYDSLTIAYRGSGGPHLINPDGSGDHLLGGLSLFSAISRLRWNVTSDSLAFYNFSYPVPGIWQVAVAGGTARRVTAIELSAFFDDAEFDWGASGFVFGYERPGLQGIWLLPAGGGPPRRLTMTTDRHASFRRAH